MTRCKIKVKSRLNVTGILLLFGILATGALLPGIMAELVSEGLSLAVKHVIPTAFPFMIISEYYIFYGAPQKLRNIGAVLGKIFGFGEGGIGAYIVGNICGFPQGARIISEEYTLGNLDKEEREVLLAYCENPSLAFVVGAVGIGMLGSCKSGIILFLSVHLSSALCGLIFRVKRVNSRNTVQTSRQKPIFVEVVMSSGRTCIDIISIIVAFSVICGLTKKLLGDGLLFGIAVSISEVTSALSYFTSSSPLEPVIRFFFIGFSLGFGGICVLLQTAIFTSRVGISLMPYLKIKLCQGLICGAVVALLERICVF